jgi:hypothetical protein
MSDINALETCTKILSRLFTFLLLNLIWQEIILFSSEYFKSISIATLTSPHSTEAKLQLMEQYATGRFLVGHLTANPSPMPYPKTSQSADKTL